MSYILFQQLDTRLSWGTVVKSNPGIYCKLQTEVDTDGIEDTGKEWQAENPTFAAI